MLTFLAGRVTTYSLTLNLTGMIDIGSLKTLVRPYDNKYHRFFLSTKRLPKSVWLKRLGAFVVNRGLSRSVEL